MILKKIRSTSDQSSFQFKEKLMSLMLVYLIYIINIRYKNSVRFYGEICLKEVGLDFNSERVISYCI